MSYIKDNIQLYQEILETFSPNNENGLEPNQRNFHVEEYTDGDKCAVDGKRRRIKVFYYCDEYTAYQNLNKNEKVDPVTKMNQWEIKSYYEQMGAFEPSKAAMTTLTEFIE